MEVRTKRLQLKRALKRREYIESSFQDTDWQHLELITKVCVLAQQDKDHCSFTDESQLLLHDYFGINSGQHALALEEMLQKAYFEIDSIYSLKVQIKYSFRILERFWMRAKHL